jgi:hypothetical protein
LKSIFDKQDKEQAAKLKLQADLVRSLVNFDRKDNKNSFGAFTTMHELGLLLGKEERWKKHVESNVSSLPRFYHSAFIWSIFYPKVDKIKQAYRKLKFYKGAPEKEGKLSGKVNAEFVRATLKLQHHMCKWPDPADAAEPVGTTAPKPQPKRDSCKKTPDGIFGKDTALYLTLLMSEMKYEHDLH